MRTLQALFFSATATPLIVAMPCYAARLSPIPAVGPAGAGNLQQTFVGAPIESPIPLWSIGPLDWSQTGEVTIFNQVLDDGGDSGNQYAMFLTAQNSTPDVWSGFEFKVTGPATFSLVAPTQFDDLPVLPSEHSVRPSHLSIRNRCHQTDR